MQDLFIQDGAPFSIGPGAFLFRNYARHIDVAIRTELRSTMATAPFRHMITPGGFQMSVQMTSCGQYGWITDLKGYRYSPVDPQSGAPWPAMPKLFSNLARDAAAQCGYHDFQPDSCLINCYAPDARMTLHQDRNEKDFSQPIVSVSLGVSAVFQFGGLSRSDRVVRIPLNHGDVLVWGGPSRLFFHGIQPVKKAHHPFWNDCRINLTFRVVALG